MVVHVQTNMIKLQDTSKNIWLHFLMFHVKLVQSNFSLRMKGRDYGHCILGCILGVIKNHKLSLLILIRMYHIPNNIATATVNTPYTKEQTHQNLFTCDV